MAEPIKMQFGMMSRLGPVNTRRGTFGVSDRLKSTESWVKESAVQQMDEPTLMICTSYDVFLRKEMPFGSRDDCDNFLITNNSLTC